MKGRLNKNYTCTMQRIGYYDRDVILKDFVSCEMSLCFVWDEKMIAKVILYNRRDVRLDRGIHTIVRDWIE